MGDGFCPVTCHPLKRCAAARLLVPPPRISSAAVACANNLKKPALTGGEGGRTRIGSRIFWRPASDPEQSVACFACWTSGKASSSQWSG